MWLNHNDVTKISLTSLKRTDQLILLAQEKSVWIADIPICSFKKSTCSLLLEARCPPKPHYPSCPELVRREKIQKNACGLK